MRLSISCHYVLCKSGFRVILLNGGPLSRSYKLSHNLLFNPKVPPWLPEGNGKILHEWTHQRQDHSMSRINPSHRKIQLSSKSCKWEALTGNQWHRTWYIPSTTNHSHAPSSLTSGFRGKSSGPRPKPGNVSSHQQGGLETSYLCHAPEQPGLWALMFKFRWK